MSLLLEKSCTKCGRVLPIEAFHMRHKKTGVRPLSECKECKSVYMKARYQRNREKICAREKLFCKNNSAHVSSIRRKRYAARSQKQIESKRLYMQKYMRERLRSDVAFRLLQAARNRLWYVVKGTAKVGRTVELLGCTPEELRMHLEKQFKPSWTWADWGTIFEIDHIIPCSRFNMTDPEQQRRCFHYSNLQPLEKEVNRSKWNKILAA